MASERMTLQGLALRLENDRHADAESIVLTAYAAGIARGVERAAAYFQTMWDDDLRAACIRTLPPVKVSLSDEIEVGQ